MNPFPPPAGRPRPAPAAPGVSIRVRRDRLVLDLLVACLTMLAATLAARAAEPGRPVEIKLATILPRGTAGFDRLQELRDEWSRASGQSVALKPVSAAHEGERQIVTHLAAGNYQAAVLSTVGLAEIDHSASRLQRPLGEVARATLPLLGVMFLGVLLITYFPALTTWLPQVLTPSSP